MYKYSRYIGHVLQHPWAITLDKLVVISELVRERTAGHKPSDEEIAARLGAETDRTTPVTPAGGVVAVIPIHGVIAHRADSFAASSGGTSVEMISKALQRAVRDDEVKAVVLDIDSPGGSVEGIPELAAKIAQAAAVKPVVAQVNALAASAAYWLASQATEIIATPSGSVGSIGVYMLLVDESEALAKEGVKINAISAGDKKLEGAPWLPLDDDGRAHLQSRVDQVYQVFVGMIASGRGTTVADVKAQYGQGRVYLVKEALKRGMIDRIATFDNTLERAVSGRLRVGSRALRAGFLGESHQPDLWATITKAGEILLPIEAPKIPPDEDGNCPEGYEKTDDGMCHPVKEATVTVPVAAGESAGDELQTARLCVDDEILAIVVTLGS